VRLSDCTDEQKVLAAAYWLLCDASPPGPHEKLPTDLCKVMFDISKLTRKHRRGSFDKELAPRTGTFRRRQRVFA
jgi:hypothetical protein